MPYLSKLTKRLALAWASIALLAACAGTDSEAVTEPGGLSEVASMRVMPESLEVRIGMSHRLVAEPRDRSGQLLQAESVTWTSSDPTIAVVDSTGTVTTLREGDAEVRARSRGVTGRSRVRSIVEPVATVMVTPSQASLEVNAQLQLTAEARSAGDSVLTGRPVLWRTSVAAVATVDTLGRVTARGAGSALISAEIEGRIGTAALNVTGPAPAPAPTPTPAPVASVTLTPATASVTAGQTAPFIATLRDANGNVLTGRSVTWSSTNSAIATVSGTGIATGVAAGSVTIRATSEGITGQGALTVLAPASPPPPPAGGAVFESSWSSGTGTTASALLDGGRWSRAGGSGFDVVSAVSVGLTAAVPSYAGNVGRARIRQASWGQVQVDNAVPASTSHTISYLFRNSAARRNDHGAGHNILRSGSNQFQILADVRYGGATTWQAGVTVFSAPYPYGRMRSPTLQNDVWYERETFIEYHPTNPVLYRAWPRIRRADGQDIAPGIREYDARNFSNAGEVSATTTLAQWYAMSASNWSTLAQGSGSSAEAARHWGIGTEDPMDAYGYDPATPAYVYWARVRVVLGGTRPTGY